MRKNESYHSSQYGWMDVKDYMVIGSIYVMFKNKQNYDGSDNDRHGALCGFWWF